MIQQDNKDYVRGQEEEGWMKIDYIDVSGTPDEFVSTKIMFYSVLS